MLLLSCIAQSGGSGQFGVCVIDMEPLEEGSGVEFESRIKGTLLLSLLASTIATLSDLTIFCSTFTYYTGGVISKPFISSVEKGVREQLQAGGPLAGYPVTDGMTSCSCLFSLLAPVC